MRSAPMPYFDAPHVNAAHYERVGENADGKPIFRRRADAPSHLPIYPPAPLPPLHPRPAPGRKFRNRNGLA